MQNARPVLAVILVAAGLVWLGQGTRIIGGGSFMVGDPTWAVIGAACVVAGIALGFVELRRRRRA